MKDDEYCGLSDTNRVNAAVDVSNKNTCHEKRSSVQQTKKSIKAHNGLYLNRSSLSYNDIKERRKIL